MIKPVYKCCPTCGKQVLNHCTHEGVRSKSVEMTIMCALDIASGFLATLEEYTNLVKARCRRYEQMIQEENENE